MIIDDYLKYMEEYSKKYGELTIVLMQVGSFFELYSIIENCPFIYKIADICNIQVSRKNKSIKDVSRSNPLMAGFPLYVLNKFIQILLQNNYTIVLIEQISPPPNPDRKITEIISPSTNINITTKKSNYILVFYFEVINDLLIVGISGVDLTTGKCFIYENGSTNKDKDITIDECYRLLSIYNPTEILILSEEIEEKYKNEILGVINNSNGLIHKKFNKYDFLNDIKKKKIEYQNLILEKAYQNKTMLSLIEYLNLERYELGRLSFCCMLQFAYEHNSEIIKELNIPELIENSKILTIEYNSALQLNIISNNETEKPLLDILNRCCTAFGSRGFKERLLNPINDIEELKKRYNKIEELLENDKYKKIYKTLNGIIDLERVKRKILLKKLNPYEWNSIINSFENAIEAFNYLSNSDYQNQIKELLEDLSIINLDESSKYNINDIKTNIFKKGYLEYVDELTDIYNKNLEKLNEIVNFISQLDESSCKLDFTEKEGFFISITKKRFENANKKNKNYMNKFNKKILSNGTIYKLTSNEINEISLIIENTQNEIQSIMIKEYFIFLDKFINKNKYLFENIIKNLTELDINTCNAKNSIDFCYYKPIINDSISNSFINAENLRHPIIERLITNVEYIPNDIFLNQNGILLYGINASGKSSFMKAVGLSIIMAQSGMYVPSTSFNYYPYSHIMTRICGNDNIYKGMSSFIVEMTELRNILQRADNNSLIIGDEICCGTEAISGISIVSAAIKELIEKKASFIFTSHLHELTSISIIKENADNLRIFHMHIEIKDNKIIYERKLKEGQGSNIYGIDVCKSLDMPILFMKNAEIVKKELQGLNTNIINLKNSNYNSNYIIDICKICNKNKATETHHINYQINADKYGNFSNFNKNQVHNLVSICNECHLKEHNGEIGIIGYKQTSEGLILEIDKKSRIFKLIKRGKKSWFYKKKISDKFIETTENEIIKFYNKQMKTSINEISIELANLFFDPTL